MDLGGVSDLDQRGDAEPGTALARRAAASPMRLPSSPLARDAARSVGGSIEAGSCRGVEGGRLG